MKTKYQIELADNGMIVRRPDEGVVYCIEYAGADDVRKIEPIAQWIGEDIIDDMLQSPDIRKEIKSLCGEDGTNDFEITVEIKPIVK